MRIRLTLIAAALAALAVASQPASGQTSGEDSVTGTAQVADGVPFLFDAHSGPSGENPSGRIELSPPSSIVARVTCLAVDGNHATVGVDVLGLGLGTLFFVEDNDGAGSDAFNSVSSGFPPDCSSGLPAGVALLPVVSGDLEVVDTQPFPTSKDQCKNGGWRNYPGFKNQGQCVAFIERGPRA